MDFSEVKQIAYLGPQASFSEMAADVFCKKYNIHPSPSPMNTIRQVIEFVDENPGVLGVVPLENSIEGSVRESIDSLMMTINPNIKILSQTIMPIRHCLLSKTTEFYSITGIISHPQALAQCQNFIHDEKTAEIYNLNILKENINDDKNNQTRFVLIGDFETQQTGNDRTSLIFATENKPGALLEILDVFYQNDINLSYIVSRPSKIKFGDYNFIVNFDGHIENPKIHKTLKEIKEKTTFMRFLGSYEK